MGRAAALALLIAVAVALSGASIALASSRASSVPQPLYSISVSGGALAIGYKPSGTTIALFSPRNVSIYVPLYVMGRKVATKRDIAKLASEMEALGKEVEAYLAANVSSLAKWIATSFYNRSQINAIVLGNFSRALNITSTWILGNFSELKSYADREILANVSAALAKAASWISGNFSALKSYADRNIAGNYTALKSWVETNYYNKTTIDSWNLIKYYTLQQNLNGNGYNITNLGYLEAQVLEAVKSLSIGSLTLSSSSTGFSESFAGRTVATYLATNNSIHLSSSLVIEEPYNISVSGWDAVYRAYDKYSGKWYELIGVYHGWTNEAIWIGGYNYYLPRNGDVNLSYAKYLYIGHYPTGGVVMSIDLGNTTKLYHVNVTGGMRVDRLASPLSIDAASLSKISGIYVSTNIAIPGSNTTVLNLTFTAPTTVILTLYISNISNVNKLGVTIDGETAWIPIISGNIEQLTVPEAVIRLAFVCTSSLVIEVSNPSSYNVYVVVSAVEVKS